MADEPKVEATNAGEDDGELPDLEDVADAVSQVSDETEATSLAKTKSIYHNPGREQEYYYLFLYRIKEGVKKLPDPTNMVGWLEENGEETGDKIPFKPTHCFLFFKTLFEATRLDMLRLIGGSIMQGDNEEEWCCGVLMPDNVKRAVEKIGAIINSRELRHETGERAIENNIDPIWFMRTLQELHYLLEQVAERNSIAIGYFE